MAAGAKHPESHPVTGAITGARSLFSEVAETPMWSMGPEETAATLLEATRMVAQAEELRARVAAHAHDLSVGEDAGATSTAAWWAHRARITHPDAHKSMRLGLALADPTHQPTRAALAAGEVNADQALVIVTAVDKLPEGLDPDLVERAERHLVGLAANYDAKRLGV